MKTLAELRLKFRYHTPPPLLRILYEGTPVAELRQEERGYRFKYLDTFAQKNLEPLPGLRLGEEYEGPDLPLYFRERLPDIRRVDVSRLVEQFKIPTDNKLLLLATLGKHTITDPFEFQLTAA